MGVRYLGKNRFSPFAFYEWFPFFPIVFFKTFFAFSGTRLHPSKVGNANNICRTYITFIINERYLRCEALKIL